MTKVGGDIKNCEKISQFIGTYFKYHKIAKLQPKVRNYIWKYFSPLKGYEPKNSNYNTNTNISIYFNIIQNFDIPYMEAAIVL